MMTRRRIKTTVAALICAGLLCAASPASARVSVTVEYAYSGVALGGIYLILYISGSWESRFAAQEIPTALLDVSAGRARLGVPLPAPPANLNADGVPGVDDSLRIDLLRWRF